MTTHTIRRIRPEFSIPATGIKVPGFIHNGSHYFTELDVYADGLVECWGAVDLEFLADKCKQGWITPTIPDGADVSIHDVIQAKVASGQWRYDSQTYHERLIEQVRRLNPSMDNLIDFKGEDVEIRNGVRHAKIGFTKATPLQTALGESSPTGRARYAFVRENGYVFLTAIRIYAGGQIDIHPRYGEERLIDLEAFEKLVSSNDISVTVPSGTLVEIDTLGRFRVVDVWSYVERPGDFIDEIADVIVELDGQPDLVAKCRQVFQEYLTEPTVRNRERLKQAYEAVPEHHRMYVGDMDTKDIPVRMVIYGDDEIENWSHRAVARSFGHEGLPTIEVPTPTDETSR